MKRKLFAGIVCFALLLSGCGAAETVWETVDDTLPVQVAAPADAYTMSFDVPVDAVASAFSDGGAQRVYAQKDGDYEISAETISAEGIDAVVRRLSGFSAEQLQIVQTRRFGMPEYQFAWYASGDEGGRLYRADVLMDGSYGYALVFSIREGLGVSYEKTAEQVFSSFNLFYDEKI